MVVPIPSLDDRILFIQADALSSGGRFEHKDPPEGRHVDTSAGNDQIEA